MVLVLDFLPCVLDIFHFVCFIDIERDGLEIHRLALLHTQCLFSFMVSERVLKILTDPSTRFFTVLQVEDLVFTVVEDHPSSSAVNDSLS